MKTILAFLLLAAASLAWGQSLPDAPSAVKQHTPITTVADSQPRDGFFTVNDGEGLLHPNKKSWALFVGSQAAMWGACVFAVRHPQSGESAGSEYPAVAGLTAIDLLAFKALMPAFSVGPPAYAVVHYVRAGLR